MKKMVSLLVVLCMLALMLPGTAVKSAATPPSVEDILNDYHAKAFEQNRESEEGGAAAYARSGSERTLEQETVEILCDAGYEAYNVTADNYDSVEALLQTDLTSMGIDREGSYIVVISGEEENSGNPNSRAGGSFIEQDDGGLGGTDNPTGDIWFEYTHDNKTYKMRYVTVTAAENPNFRKVDEVKLNEEFGPNDVLEIVGMASSTVGLLSGTVIVGGVATSLVILNTPVSIALLITGMISNYTPSYRDLIEMVCESIWTVKYTQIYNSGDNEWYLNAGVEYVTVQKLVNYSVYNPNTNRYDNGRVCFDDEVLYSALYNDPETMKVRAVHAYEYGNHEEHYLDTVDQVEFRFGEGGAEKTINTHYRTTYDFVD